MNEITAEKGPEDMPEIKNVKSSVKMMRASE
jgi:hypothetical protein